MIIRDKEEVYEPSKVIEMPRRNLRSAKNISMDREEGLNAENRENPIQDGINKTNTQVKKEVKNKITEEVLPIKRVNETTILVHPDKNYPYLQKNKNGLIEEIPIKKENFIIGRAEGQADYISQNSAVGKMHAEIVLKYKKYYIKDLNSRNGTFINDNRVEPNKEVEIKCNDKITLANEEYIFIVPV